MVGLMGPELQSYIYIYIYEQQKRKNEHFRPRGYIFFHTQLN